MKAFEDVSVIIPCHDAEAYLAQTIESVLGQSLAPKEIIVVLDNCSDTSAEITRQFGRRVRWRAVSFGCASKARNFGAAVASGHALMFLDADDLLGPETLEALLTTLSERAVEGIALCPWYRLERRGFDWVKRRASVPSGTPPDDPLRAWLRGWYYPPCSVLWSRAAFERLGGWDEELTVNDDGDLMMRAMVEGIPVVRGERGAAFYRRVPENASLSGQRFTDEGMGSSLRVLEKIAIWLEQRGRIASYRFALADALEAIARNCRAGGLRQREAECERLRDRYGPPRWLLRVQRSVGHRARWVNRRLPLVRARASGSPQALKGPVEEVIDYGWDVARSLSGDGQTVELTDAALGRWPAVSVIIPTYNRAPLVGRAIRSVLAQTFDDLEVLVVDDASQDNTAEVVAAFDDPRVRYLRQPVNRDVSAARNRGLREARGEFIGFVDSDDEWLPDKLAEQVALFRALPQRVGLIYTGAWLVTEHRVREESPSERGALFRRLLLKNVTTGGSVSTMIRRNVIRVAGFFDETLVAMEDYDYWIRVGRFYEFEFVARPLVRYYDLETPQRRSLVRDKDISAREQLFRKYRHALKHAGLSHRFHLISARRRLVWIRPPDRLGAIGLMLRAIVSRPTAYEPYRTVAPHLVPQRFRAFLRARLRTGG